jgi:hypothetical protein
MQFFFASLESVDDPIPSTLLHQHPITILADRPTVCRPPVDAWEGDTAWKSACQFPIYSLDGRDSQRLAGGEEHACSQRVDGALAQDKIAGCAARLRCTLVCARFERRQWEPVDGGVRVGGCDVAVGLVASSTT